MCESPRVRLHRERGIFSNVFQAPALSVSSSGQRSLALLPLSVTDLWLGRLIDGDPVLVFRTAYGVQNLPHTYQVHYLFPVSHVATNKINLARQTPRYKKERAGTHRHNEAEFVWRDVEKFIRACYLQPALWSLRRIRSKPRKWRAYGPPFLFSAFRFPAFRSSRFVSVSNSASIRKNWLRCSLAHRVPPSGPDSHAARNSSQPGPVLRLRCGFASVVFAIGSISFL
jgi:hypothetical protein